MRVCERVGVFCALVLLTLSLCMALSAALTDFWVQADAMARNGTASAQNAMNSGLFHGTRQLDWAFGPRQKQFSVFEEVQFGLSFLDKHCWFATLFSTGLGLLWNVVGLLVALRNAAMLNGEELGGGPKRTTVFGPWGICLWSTLAAVSYGTSALLFLYQFFARIKSNVLLPEQLAAGFSSENCVELGFSFWLLVNAISAQVVPCVLLFCLLRDGNAKERSAKRGDQHTGADDTVFMY